MRHRLLAALDAQVPSGAAAGGVRAATYLVECQSRPADRDAAPGEWLRRRKSLLERARPGCVVVEEREPERPRRLVARALMDRVANPCRASARRGTGLHVEALVEPARVRNGRKPGC